MVSPSQITINSDSQIFFLLTFTKEVPYSKIGSNVVGELNDLPENHITRDFSTLTCILLIAIYLAKESNKSVLRKSLTCV